MSEENKLVIEKPAPEFEAEVFQNEEIKRVSLKDYRGKWVVLFFYPKDFTFVCPTELEEIAKRYDEIQKLDAEVIGISTDTAVVHKAWHDHSEAIKKVKFPLLADPTGRICKAYGTYIEEEGVSLRGSFLIDPKGILKTIEVHGDAIGRNIDELMRRIQAAQFVAAHGDQVCPVNWKPGGKTLKPGLDLVGKI